MAFLHALQHFRGIAVGLFSLTAVSLFAFQSVEVVHAFIAMFSETFHKN